MDALVIVCSRNTSEILVWAWMLWSSYALDIVCSWNMNENMGMDGHACFCHNMLSEHERYYGLGMDALVIVCSRNTNEIMAWAWMLWSSYAVGTQTRLRFGHGCSGHCMLSEHERDYPLEMTGTGLRGRICARMLCSRSTGH